MRDPPSTRLALILSDCTLMGVMAVPVTERCAPYRLLAGRDEQRFPKYGPSLNDLGVINFCGLTCACSNATGLRRNDADREGSNEMREGRVSTIRSMRTAQRRVALTSSPDIRLSVPCDPRDVVSKLFGQGLVGHSELLSGPTRRLGKSYVPYPCSSPTPSGVQPTRVKFLNV